MDFYDGVIQLDILSLDIQWWISKSQNRKGYSLIEASITMSNICMFCVFLQKRFILKLGRIHATRSQQLHFLS